MIIEKLQKNIVNTQIENIYYLEVENELHVKLWSWVLLIFDLSENIDMQIEALAVFNKEAKGINKTWIVYIDLRVSGKIFYCETDREYQCKLNLKDTYWY